MTATIPMTNGRPQRKQLSDQLDRLDSIIDGLCEGLPLAVADAAKEGTRQAVKDAILEIMTNPELRGMIQTLTPAPMSVPTATPPVETAPPTPSLWSRIKAKVAAARTAIVERYCATKEAITTMTRTLSTMMPLRRIVLVAVGVGVVAAVLGYAAPAGVAAVIAGIGGMVSALVAQIGSWFRRTKQFFRAT